MGSNPILLISFCLSQHLAIAPRGGILVMLDFFLHSQLEKACMVNRALVC